jgi:hypothetical protein
MRWEEFEAACADLAHLARQRFADDELVLLGTIRADGRPRISPTEPDFAAGHLFLGMMWRSPKALDLRRDPRCVVHSVPSDRLNPRGDVKLYGHALEIGDAELRESYREPIRARIDWAPEEPRYHLFALDVDEAAYLRFGADGQDTWRWRPDRGLDRQSKPGA